MKKQRLRGKKKLPEITHLIIIVNRAGMRFQFQSPNILKQSDAWFSTFPQNSYLLLSVAAVPAEGSGPRLSHCESILREASLNYHWGTEGCIFQEFGRPQQEATTGLWQKITFQQHCQFQRPPTFHLQPPPTAAVLWEAVAVCLPLKGKCIPPPCPLLRPHLGFQPQSWGSAPTWRN